MTQKTDVSDGGVTFMRAAFVVADNQGMRRDYFTLATGVQPDDEERPTMRITYEGPFEEFEPRLRRGDSWLDSEEIDITYRLQAPLGSDGPMGVLAIANRVTGEYVLELNAPSNVIFALTDAVGESEEGDTPYRVIIERDDGSEIASYDKSTLLIYDHEGELLRERSLIPSGVEI